MPDGALVLLSAGLGLALAAAALLTLRRSGAVAAATREVDASRRQILELAAAADAAMAPVLTRIDAVRRRLIEPADVADELTIARGHMEGLAEEARSLTVTPSFRAVRADLVEDIERAGRALDMVEHGCGVLADARPRGRELEAQTAIKRGYLNLLHAREAVARHAAAAAEVGSLSVRPDVGRGLG